MAGLASVLLAIAWLATHPTPRFAKVDVSTVFEERKQALTNKVTPDMPEQEQRALLQSAADYGRQVGQALQALADECGCVILNSAAILQSPSFGKRSAPDLTWRLREILANAPPGPK